MDSYAGGSATFIPVTADGGCGGTAIIVGTEPPPFVAGGSVSVDDSIASAFIAPMIGTRVADRVVGARVTLDGSDIDTLVGGVIIARELDNMIESAEFEVADPRVARFHPSTFSWGEKDVSIALLAGPPGGVKEWGAFTGRTEAPSNTGAYRPRGRFQAVGLSADWADKSICITADAYSGKHRGELLRLALESIGATTDTPNIDSWGAIVKRFQEIMGPFKDFAAAVGLIEGVRFRVVNNVFEFVREDELASGVVMFAFDESSIISMEEIPPTRPSLVFHFVGTLMTEASAGEAGQRTVELPIDLQVDGDGRPYYTCITLVKDKDTILRRTAIDYKSVAADGVTTGPVTLQPVTKVEEENSYTRIDYPSGDYDYSNQLTNRVVRRYELTGVPASADNGAASDWVGGGRFTAPSASLTLVEQITEHYVYDLTDCTLKSSVTVREELFSPRIDPATPGHQYADGMWRSALAMTMQETGRATTYWNDQRNPNVGALPSVSASTRLERWLPTARAASPYEDQFIDSYRTAETIRREWVAMNGSNTSHDYAVTTSVPGGIVLTTDGMAPPPGRTHETIQGAVPGPPIGSETSAQYAQQPFEAAIDRSTAYPFAAVSQNEALTLVETVDEIQAVGDHLLSRALSTQYRITTRSIPFLLPGHGVSVKQTSRSITIPIRGYVEKTEPTHTVDPDNAQGLQVTTVTVPL